MTGTHSFNVELARRIGMDNAVILQHIHYWCSQNRKGKRNSHGLEFTVMKDGCENTESRIFYWTYSTVAEYAETFPYLTEKQIRRILSYLEDNGLLYTGIFNKNCYDRTKWYTVSPKGIQLLRECLANSVDDVSEDMPDSPQDLHGDSGDDGMPQEDTEAEHAGESRGETYCYEGACGNREESLAKSFMPENAVLQKVISNCPNGQIERPKKANQFSQKGGSIPNLNTNLNTNLNQPPDTSSCPPSLSDVRKFSRENSMREGAAESFYNYFSGTGWTSGSSPIKNWKPFFLAWYANHRSSPAVGRNFGVDNTYRNPGGILFKTVKC